jgi:hypothetical protein
MATQLKLENKSEVQQFHAQQEIISQLEILEKSNPEKISSLNKLVYDFEKELQISKLDFGTIAAGKTRSFRILASSLLLIAGLPVFIYGYLNNFFPWQITISLAAKINDPQFRSSVKYILSILLFPIFYLIQTLLIFIFLTEKWIDLAYFISLPLSAMFSWSYFNFFNKTKRRYKLFRLIISNSLDYKRLKELYSKITEEIKSILSS